MIGNKYFNSINLKNRRLKCNYRWLVSLYPKLVLILKSTYLLRRRPRKTRTIFEFNHTNEKDKFSMKIGSNIWQRIWWNFNKTHIIDIINLPFILLDLLLFLSKLLSSLIFVLVSLVHSQKDKLAYRNSFNVHKCKGLKYLFSHI